MLWGAIIVAAGHGTRFGERKQLVEVAGAPMLAWSARLLLSMTEISHLIVVTEAQDGDAVRQLMTTIAGEKPFEVIAGGATRQASVRAGLEAVPEACVAVLVHDGARPLLLAHDARNAMKVVADGTASLLAVPVADTIKVVDAKGQVTRTLDRQELWAAQTPQCAMARDLRRAHHDALRNGTTANDDATLLERAGLQVIAVAGSPENFKITVPADLARAELLLRERAPWGPEREEILLVEMFVEAKLVAAVCGDVEARGGTIDGIERDLPDGVAIRAYVSSENVAGFEERLASVSGGRALCTTHFSHFAQRHPHDGLAAPSV
ncbi:MAG: 2-C-methyl-D-erythritol 4-phosphate cytidylyltransferase [Candidatus Meridianibacter frigidus]|nr:MAG: 2-C-methyl-D-erythritol 4-phosphate cytidylyltransferase [Candidatus Eremiobacteraeota bacterium]